MVRSIVRYPSRVIYDEDKILGILPNGLKVLNILFAQALVWLRVARACFDRFV